MSGQAARSLEWVSGRVTSVNPKGLKLDGGADWMNFSKYAEGIVPPSKGETVRVGLDSAGFVREVESEGGSAAGARPSGGGQRDHVITRLAVLKAAAEFAASRPGVTSAEVLKVAEAWERWVNRPADATDTVDAF